MPWRQYEYPEQDGDLSLCLGSSVRTDETEVNLAQAGESVVLRYSAALGLLFHCVCTESEQTHQEPSEDSYMTA